MQIVIPYISALYAGIVALIVLALAINVSINRGRRKVFVGDGGNADMTKVMRAHQNAAEYVPLSLVLIVLIEMIGAPATAIHVLGIGLVVARIVHAMGLYRTAALTPARAIGATINWLVILIAAVYAIYLYSKGAGV